MDINSSVLSSEVITGNIIQKRLHDGFYPSILPENTAPRKRRRSSMPFVHILGNAGASGGLSRSKSCDALNGHDEVGPVQLLRTYKLGQKQTNNFNAASSVKPTQENIAAYEIPVVAAVRSSDLETLRMLRDEGKSLNACNRSGESLVHIACRRGNTEVVRFMVEEAKVNVNVRDDYGRTILHDAAWTSTPNFDVMDILLRAMKPEMLLAEDARGHTPFDYARRDHWPEWVEYLSVRRDEIEAASQEQPLIQLVA